MSPTNGSYVLVSKITSLAGPVLCIAGSQDGKLACGGVGGTGVWLIPSLSPAVTPGGPGQRGATTAIVWITKEDEPEDILLFGTQSGHLVAWKEADGSEEASTDASFEEVACAQIARPGEITGLSFDPSTSRIAVCNRNSVVQVFTVDANVSLRNVFSVTIPNHIPKGVSFLKSGHSQTVLSFGMYDGKIQRLNGNTGAVEDVIETGGMIGNAQHDGKRNIACLDDPVQGVALYRLDTKVCVRTYHVPVEKSMRPRQVGFAEDSSCILVGSDHGRVYLFDRRKGEKVEELSVGHAGWVQTVMAVDMLETPYVIAAKSFDDGNAGELYVWKKSTFSKPAWAWRSRLTQAALILASFGFIYQNVGVIRLLLKICLALVKFVTDLMEFGLARSEANEFDI